MKRIGTLTQGFLTILLSAILVGLGEWYTSEPVIRSEPLPPFVATQAPLPAPVDSYLAGIIMHDPEIWNTSRKEETELGPPLARFFASLQQLEMKPDRSKVRIAYFGDSMIEGDRITQSLRNDLQKIFGGNGVGFVPVVYANYGDRRTIWHRFSSDWEDMNFMKPSRPKYGLGISGEYFLTSQPRTAGRTWVRYKGSNEYNTTKVFEQVRLFYGKKAKEKTKPSDYFVAVKTEQVKDTFFLNGNNVVNEKLISSVPTKEVKLNFRIPKDMPVYGLSFESPSGIFVDNFSARGHSGMNLIEIPGENLSEFSHLLDYDLIVLQFGLNVVSTKRKDFSSYEKGMKRVVEHFKKHAPNSAILMVSVSDKSTRIQGSLQTDPSVPLIVKAQERVAMQTNSAFLNLYESMGGRNSMIQWVKSKPSLARNDYAHPNRRGAIKVGDIVKHYLLQEYSAHTGKEILPPGSMAIK
ncbi:MAG: hypothetical protein MRZ79_09275 [Bacteroidia bacterium]|nr:hypothetical protein [Bacteroidia bacterium]